MWSNSATVSSCLRYYITEPYSDTEAARSKDSVARVL